MDRYVNKFLKCSSYS